MGQVKTAVVSGSFLVNVTTAFDQFMTGVFNGVSGIFKYPASGDTMFADGKAAITSMFSNFKAFDDQLKQLANKVNSLPAAVKTKMNLPTIPGSILEVAGADYADIIGVFL
jgi:hypothetical protein